MSALIVWVAAVCWHVNSGPVPRATIAVGRLPASGEHFFSDTGQHLFFWIAQQSIKASFSESETSPPADLATGDEGIEVERGAPAVPAGQKCPTISLHELDRRATQLFRSRSVSLQPRRSLDRTLLSFRNTEDQLEVWDLPKRRVHLVPMPARLLKFAPDDHAAAIEVGPSSVKILEIETGKEITLHAPTSFNSKIPSTPICVFSPDSSRLAMVDEEGMCMWDVATGERLVNYRSWPMQQDVPVFSPDSKLLAWNSTAAESTFGALCRRLGRYVPIADGFGEPKRKMIVRDARNGAVRLEVPTCALATFADGDTLVTYTWPDSVVRVWSVHRGIFPIGAGACALYVSAVALSGLWWYLRSRWRPQAS